MWLGNNSMSTGADQIEPRKPVAHVAIVYIIIIIIIIILLGTAAIGGNRSNRRGRLILLNSRWQPTTDWAEASLSSPTAVTMVSSMAVLFFLPLCHIPVSRATQGNIASSIRPSAIIANANIGPHINNKKNVKKAYCLFVCLSFFFTSLFDWRLVDVVFNHIVRRNCCHHRTVSWCQPASIRPWP